MGTQLGVREFAVVSPLNASLWTGLPTSLGRKQTNPSQRHGSLPFTEQGFPPMALDACLTHTEPAEGDV